MRLCSVCCWNDTVGWLSVGWCWCWRRAWRYQRRYISHFFVFIACMVFDGKSFVSNWYSYWIVEIPFPLTSPNVSSIRRFFVFFCCGLSYSQHIGKRCQRSSMFTFHSVYSIRIYSYVGRELATVGLRIAVASYCRLNQLWRLIVILRSNCHSHQTSFTLFNCHRFPLSYYSSVTISVSCIA